MSLFKKKQTEEVRAEETTGTEIDDPILAALLNKTSVTRDEAMQVPTFAGCVNKICETVSIIPIRLYEKTKEGVNEIEDDDRVRLLNEDTRDTLDAVSFKRAITYDYLTAKGGYAFINAHGKRFLSLNYVDSGRVAFQEGTDPIFKDYKILVNGKAYEDYQFLKVLRRTENGYLGRSIVEESNVLLTVAYKSLKFEGKLIDRGGNKKGFLETEHKLDEKALETLKNGFNKMYSDDNENAIVLNNGLKFHESSNSATELQLNENKKANATEICKLFGMPPNILTGGANEEERKQYIQYCIIPILEEIIAAINRDLLLEEEKGRHFFDYDVSELTRADIKTRYEAYAIGYKNRFLQISEIRKMENLPDIDIPFFMMGLNDVLYEPESGDIFIPNMNQWANIKDPTKFPWREDQKAGIPAEDEGADESGKEDKEDDSDDQS